MFHFKKRIAELKNSFSFRFLVSYSKNHNVIKVGEKSFLNFSSNDYLLFSEHRDLIENSIAYTQKYGVGSTASRLVCAHNEAFEEAEGLIKELKAAESALIFNSGYTANIGILPSLLDKKSMVFFDRLAHASLIDGIRLSGSGWTRFNHNDLNHLEHLLKKNRQVEKKLIVTESVFSMNGDKAPIKDIHAICEKYDAYLYVDEAHATGVVGEYSNGLLGQEGLSISSRVLGMGTFGKAFGSYGAFFFGSDLIRDWLINTSRSLIFSTALPPGVMGANIAALKLIQKNPGLGSELLKKAAGFRQTLRQNNIPLVAGDTQIISILTGNNQRTLACSKLLKARGILAVGIRPPTVPINEGRIRLAINIGHTEKELNNLLQALVDFFKT